MAKMMNRKMESALGQAMVKVTQDNSWYSRT